MTIEFTNAAGQRCTATELFKNNPDAVPAEVIDLAEWGSYGFEFNFKSGYGASELDGPHHERTAAIASALRRHDEVRTGRVLLHGGTIVEVDAPSVTVRHVIEVANLDTGTTTVHVAVDRAELRGE